MHRRASAYRHSRYVKDSADLIFPKKVALSNLGHSPLNHLFGLFPSPFLKPRHDTTLKFLNGQIFARKGLARWGGIEIRIIDVRRAGCDIPPSSIPGEFDFNICAEHVPFIRVQMRWERVSRSGACWRRTEAGGCAHSLPRIRGSDTCEAESRRRANKTVTIPGSDVHSVAEGRRAASTSFGGQLPELLSCPLHRPVNRSEACRENVAREIPK
jgi:hypothetical protein